ncbi:TPA: oligosaccharide flippase family protein [Enterobacter kobei]
MPKKNVVENILFLSVIQFANYLAPLMVLPFLSRILGVEGFGLIMVAFSACTLCFLLTDFGFNLSAPYWIARNSGYKNRVSRVIGAIFIIKSLILLIIGLMLLLYVVLYTNNTTHIRLMYTIIYCIAISQAFQPVWFFQGIEKMKNVTIFMVTAKLSYLILIFIFVRNKEDDLIVLLCFFISNFIATIIGVGLIWMSGYKIMIPTRKIIADTFRSSSSFFLSRLAVGVYTNASTLIVGAASGVVQAGLYSSAEKLYQAGQNLTSPISQALYPYVARTGNKNVLFKTILFLLIPMILGCSICYIYAAEIIKLIYGAYFVSAQYVLKIFLIISVVTFVSVNLGYPAFAAMGKVKLANYTVMFGGTVQVLLLVILYTINSISAVNVALSVLTTEILVLAVRILLLLKLNLKIYEEYR